MLFVFCFWFTLLSIMVSSYIRFVAKDRILFFIMAEKYSIIYIFTLSTHHLGWFHTSTTVNWVATYEGIQITTFSYANFISFELISSFQRNLHSAFYSGSTSLHSNSALEYPFLPILTSILYLFIIFHFWMIEKKKRREPLLFLMKNWNFRNFTLKIFTEKKKHYYFVENTQSVLWYCNKNTRVSVVYKEKRLIFRIPTG